MSSALLKAAQERIRELETLLSREQVRTAWYKAQSPSMPGSSIARMPAAGSIGPAESIETFVREELSHSASAARTPAIDSVYAVLMPNRKFQYTQEPEFTATNDRFQDHYVILRLMSSQPLAPQEQTNALCALAADVRKRAKAHSGWEPCAIFSIEPETL